METATFALSLLSASLVSAPFWAAADPIMTRGTTRLQATHPVAVPTGTVKVLPKEVAKYSTYGYIPWISVSYSATWPTTPSITSCVGSSMSSMENISRQTREPNSAPARSHIRNHSRLRCSIGPLPWYETISNHDQFWIGAIFPNEKLQNAVVGSTILDIGPYLLGANNSDSTGVSVGVVEGTTPFGDVIKGGPESKFTTPPPTIVADTTGVALVEIFEVP